MSSMKLLELRRDLLEKIVDYADTSFIDLAEVCKTFYDIVCKTKLFTLRVDCFEDFLAYNARAFNAIFESNRRINRLEVSLATEYEQVKAIELIAKIGSNIEELSIATSRYIKLADWQRIMSCVPNCHSLELENLMNNSERNERIKYFNPKLKVLKMTTNKAFFEKFHLCTFDVTTLTEIVIKIDMLSCKVLKSLCERQSRLKKVSLNFTILNKIRNDIFRESNLESLKITYLGGSNKETLTPLLSNHRQLRELTLEVSAHTPVEKSHILNYIPSLVSLELSEGASLYNFQEIASQPTLKRLKVADKFFEVCFDISTLDFSGLTELTLFNTGAMLPSGFPCEELALSMRNLRRIELYSTNNNEDVMCFFEHCATKFPALIHGLEDFSMVCVDCPNYTIGFPHITPLSLERILDDGRESQFMKKIHFSIPIKLTTVHILKLVYDYPNIESAVINTGRYITIEKRLQLCFLQIILEGWTKLRHLDFKFNNVELEHVDLHFLHDHGLELKEIKLKCERFIDVDLLQSIFSYRFKRIECDDREFCGRN